MPYPVSESTPQLSRSLPDQIANHLGVAIVDGIYKDGERILEERVAEQFQVSRAPVREALVKLERRGFVRLLPRRGAHVIGLTLDVVADMFNVRALLVGLAGRYYAIHRTEEHLEQTIRAVAELRKAAADTKIEPLQFGVLGSRIGVDIYKNCSADFLMRMMAEHSHGSLWSMIWRDRPLDLQTVARRKAYAADFQKFVELVRDKRDCDAELLFRRMVYESRDCVVKNLAALRGDKSAPKNLFYDPT